MRVLAFFLVLAVGVVVSVLCTTAAAGVVTVSATAPVVDGADIAQLTGFSDIGGNEGHIWSNRPIQGQTFQTGGNASGYTLNAVTLQNLNNTTTSGNFTVRLGTISGVAFSGIATESTDTAPYVPGDYITATFDTPVALNANTLYGFDWGVNGNGFVTANNLDSSSDVYAAGTAYSSGGGGTPDDTNLLSRAGDRVFHLDMVASTGPAPPTPQPIDVPNFNFELDNTGNPSTTKRGLDQVLGWTGGTGTTGVENYGGGGTEGIMATYMGDSSSFYQILGETVDLGTTYTMTYDGRANCCGGNSMIASFFYDDGGTHVEIASETTSLTSTWQEDIDTLSFTADAGQAYLGQALGIKFAAPVNWMAVDNVRLSALGAVSAAVPEPSTFALAALSLLGLGWYGWRRRRRAA